VSGEEEVCEFLAKVEALHVKRLIRSWVRDPESFATNVRQLEDVIDFRKKICA
jgi:hypothetical protein